jgi:hypothetical protein
MVVLGSLGVVAAGCGSDSAPDSPGSGGNTQQGGAPSCGSDSESVAGTTGEFEPLVAADSACGAVFTQEPVPTSPVVHSPACSSLRYSSNPPSSGDHYSRWADFIEYTEAVPRGNWVHSLEHQALVVVYNCTDCEDEVQAARDWIDTLPEDPLCAQFGRVRRVVLTPDPLLDVRWGAAVWGFTLRSDCFEAEVFDTFAREHPGPAPENTCYPPQ